VLDAVLHLVLEVQSVLDGSLDFLVDVVLGGRVFVVVEAHVGQVADLFLLAVFEFNGDFAVFEADGFDLQESRVERVFTGGVALAGLCQGRACFFELGFGQQRKGHFVVGEVQKLVFVCEKRVEFPLGAH